jgi:hypothetical protein
VGRHTEVELHIVQGERVIGDRIDVLSDELAKSREQ